MRSWELKGSKLKGIYFSGLEQELTKLSSLVITSLILLF